jgi:hypothetical protein
VAGACECAGDLAFCGGSCVDTTTSSAHCGSCGNSCDTLFELCSDSNCACKPGLLACGNQCLDVQNDPTHCGNCGTECRGDQICDGGDCACRPGLTDCGGTCVDLTSDVNHCGACASAACGADQKCEAGVCAAASADCGNGLTACDASNNRVACIDTDKDPNNCGDCGNRCDRDELCVAGNCRGYAPAAGCTSCPCSDVCDALIDNTNICCDAANTNDVPICVRGSTCP